MTTTRTPLSIIAPDKLSIISGRPITRQCGNCTACCHTLALESLKKPYHCDCKYVGPGRCNIYADRPFDCSGYECIWLAGLGDLSHRPDLSGLLWNANPMDTHTDSARLYVDVHEISPDVLRRFSVKKFAALLNAVPDMFSENLQGFLAGLRIFPHGLPLGAAFKSAPCYPDVTTHGLLFHPLNPGVQLYLGPCDADGFLLEDGRPVPQADMNAAIKRVISRVSE